MPVTNEEPIWLRRAAAKHMPEAGDGAFAAALRSRGLGSPHGRRWLDWDGLPSADASVYAFPERSSAESESDTAPGGGEVVSFRRG